MWNSTNRTLSSSAKVFFSSFLNMTVFLTFPLSSSKTSFQFQDVVWLCLRKAKHLSFVINCLLERWNSLRKILDGNILYYIINHVPSYTLKKVTVIETEWKILSVSPWCKFTIQKYLVTRCKYSDTFLTFLFPISFHLHFLQPHNIPLLSTIFFLNIYFTQEAASVVWRAIVVRKVKHIDRQVILQRKYWT